MGRGKREENPLDISTLLKKNQHTHKRVEERESKVDRVRSSSKGSGERDPQMASVTVTASCPASSAFGGSKLSKSPAAPPRMAVALSQQQPKGGAMVRAQAAETEAVEKKSSSRRDVVFGAAASAVFWSAVSATGEANAADEPKKGSAEAKKLYAPVCVTMPTSRICRN